MKHLSRPRTWRLGLIGGNIAASRSPVLHMVCALSVGGNASYDLIIPEERGLGLAGLLDQCAKHGFDGVNVTYPYKEQVAKLVPAGNPVVTAMGSSNTIRFTPEGPRAFNTDYSGFVAAFRERFGASPGRVLVIGAGGVGRAVTFGLAELGSTGIVLHDSDPAKVASLARAIAKQYPGLPVQTAEPGQLADLSGLDGAVNCTPLGMVGRPGSPLPDGVRGAVSWAFDAVYTPDRTEFRRQVEASGATFLSGYELYFHQGVQAFQIFTGEQPDDGWVRDILNRGLAQL
ncbi:MAG: shikimate dehydrogenase family protein [Paracoccaceae bacterium]